MIEIILDLYYLDIMSRNMKKVHFGDDALLVIYCCALFAIAFVIEVIQKG